MIKHLRKYFNKKVIALKGEIKLNFTYPKKFAKSSIKSILPHSVENLIKEDVIIDKDVTISSHLQNIGAGVYIGWNTSITQCKSIGAFTSISNGVKIGLANHALDHISTSPLFYAKRRGWVTHDTFVEEDESFVEIGPDVLISANVIVLKNIKIGHGAVIGAGSVVTKDVPPYAVVAGVPAKLIKYRFDEVTIVKLMESEWWKMPLEKIKANHNLFNNVDAFLNAIKK